LAPIESGPARLPVLVTISHDVEHINSSSTGYEEDLKNALSRLDFRWHMKRKYAIKFQN
jgi:hypothetical protein